jgi:hypothetical protein
LIVQLEREANVIAKETRRGKGNIWFARLTLLLLWLLVCSTMLLLCLPTCKLTTLATHSQVLNGRTRVYIDPYAVADYVNVGYKGTNPYDAGVFYCPYVPLQMVRAVGENDFQPRIGFKTRYGMASNPFVGTLLLTVLLLPVLTSTTESSAWTTSSPKHIKKEFFTRHLKTSGPWDSSSPFFYAYK